MSLPTLAGNSRWIFEVDYLYGLTYPKPQSLNKVAWHPQKVFEINPAMHRSGCVNRYNRSDKLDWVPPRSVKLLGQVRERVRYLRCSL
jgi:hypothetical protein